MQITSFQLSEVNNQLELTITDAADVVSFVLWKQDTYKDYSKALDFSSKLTGAATENLTLSLTDLNETFFDGIYFIEVEDTNETSFALTYKLTRYKECILDKAAESIECSDCLKEKNIELINADTILRNLEFALELQFIDEIIQFSNALEKLCSSDCRSCGSYTDMLDENKFSNNNPDEIELIIDGGQL